jgi:hypothetical protein
MKVAGALRSRRTPINCGIPPNGGLVQVESYWTTSAFDRVGIAAVSATTRASHTRQLASSHHPKCR